MLTTSDTLIKWWHQRSATEISDISFENGKLSFSVNTPAEGGVVVKIPVGTYTASEVNGPYRLVERFGGKWLLLPVPKGERRFEVSLH